MLACLLACACVSVFACECVRVCACARARACVRVSACACAGGPILHLALRPERFQHSADFRASPVQRRLHVGQLARCRHVRRRGGALPGLGLLLQDTPLLKHGNEEAVHRCEHVDFAENGRAMTDEHNITASEDFELRRSSLPRRQQGSLRTQRELCAKRLTDFR